jgi:WD40 repeat protein
MTFKSYYGGFKCIKWSSNGKYLLTGGEDDLISLWGVHEQRLLARFKGHQSFVSDVEFDDYASDSSNTVFVSVSHDTFLCVWEFCPEQIQNNLEEQQSPISDFKGNSINEMPQMLNATSKLMDANSVSGSFQFEYVTPIVGKDQADLIEPNFAVRVMDEPLTHIKVLASGYLVTSYRGHSLFYSRKRLK